MPPKILSILNSAGLMCLENTFFALCILMQKLMNIRIQHTLVITVHLWRTSATLRYPLFGFKNSHILRVQCKEKEKENKPTIKKHNHQTQNHKEERRWTFKIATPEQSLKIEAKVFKNVQRGPWQLGQSTELRKIKKLLKENLLWEHITK